MYCLRHAAPGGSYRKEQQARREYALSSQTITQRAADQNQRGEHQRVSLDNPLRPDYISAQLMLEHWQRDVDDCAVNKSNARPQDGRGKHPWRG